LQLSQCSETGTTCSCPTHAYTTVQLRVQTTAELCAWWLPRLYVRQCGSHARSLSGRMPYYVWLLAHVCGPHVRRARIPMKLLGSLNSPRSTCRVRLQYGEKVRRAPRGRTDRLREATGVSAVDHADRSQSAVWLPEYWFRATSYLRIG
jgi:hypothetical protein